LDWQPKKKTAKAQEMKETDENQGGSKWPLESTGKRRERESESYSIAERRMKINIQPSFPFVTDLHEKDVCFSMASRSATNTAS
jgi:hypothetical protein